MRATSGLDKWSDCSQHHKAGQEPDLRRYHCQPIVEQVSAKVGSNANRHSGLNCGQSARLAEVRTPSSADGVHLWLCVFLCRVRVRARAPVCGRVTAQMCGVIAHRLRRLVSSPSSDGITVS